MKQQHVSERKQNAQRHANQRTERSTTSSWEQEHPFLHAQAIVGNHGVLRRVEFSDIQPKLKINQPGDIYEQEADRVAGEVMRMPEPQLVNETSSQKPEIILEFQSHLNGFRGGGQPLPQPVRDFFEPRFGYDLSHVRVHKDATAAQCARAINARAFSISNEVVFDNGEFQPDTWRGRNLIAHELIHVVQQGMSLLDNHLSMDSLPGVKRQKDPAGTPQVSKRIHSPVIQMQRRGGAGGCGICIPGNSIEQKNKRAGHAAHFAIQQWFEMTYGFARERAIRVAPGDETPPFIPSLDLSRRRERLGETIIQIGEIKPLDDRRQQRRKGRRQLQDYFAQLEESPGADEVQRMRLRPPPLLPFPEVTPVGCPQQQIVTTRPEPGLYQYYCEPPWSTLVRDPRCRCSRRRRRRETAEVSALGATVEEETGAETTEEQRRPPRAPEESRVPVFEDQPDYRLEDLFSIYAAGMFTDERIRYAIVGRLNRKERIGEIRHLVSFLRYNSDVRHNAWLSGAVLWRIKTSRHTQLIHYLDLYSHGIWRDREIEGRIRALVERDLAEGRDEDIRYYLAHPGVVDQTEWTEWLQTLMENRLERVAQEPPFRLVLQMREEWDARTRTAPDHYQRDLAIVDARTSIAVLRYIEQLNPELDVNDLPENGSQPPRNLILVLTRQRDISRYIRFDRGIWRSFNPREALRERLQHQVYRQAFLDEFEREMGRPCPWNVETRLPVCL